MRGTMQEIMRNLEEWFRNEPAILEARREYGERGPEPVAPLHLRAAGDVTIRIGITEDQDSGYTEIAAVCRGPQVGARVLRTRHAGATLERFRGDVYRAINLIGFKVTVMEMLGDVTAAEQAAARERCAAHERRTERAGKAKADDGDAAFRAALLARIRGEE